jgi:anti-sigma regulatory factor (Ser/Thr protein kinase)
MLREHKETKNREGTAARTVYADARLRSAVRERLDGATNGRLRLYDRTEDLPAMGQPVGEPIPLTPHSLRGLREQVAAATIRQGLSAERMYDLITAVGEAATNAVVHGGGGEARVFTDEQGGVRVLIQDRGHGISLEELPRAALERGYSSAGTLGQGFWIILHSADRVHLSTGAHGTTVVLEQRRTPVTAEMPVSTAYSRPVVLS